MKSLDKFLSEGVFRYTWDAVLLSDVKKYAKVSKLKLIRDPENKEFLIGLRAGSKKIVFRYDPEELDLFSDHTILELEDGRVK